MLRTDKTLDQYYRSTVNQVVALNRLLSGWTPLLAAGPRSASEFIQALSELKSTISAIDELLAQPAVPQWAKDNLDDQTYDLVLEIGSVRTAAIAVRDWIFTNFPKQLQGGTEWWLISTYDVNGSQTVRSFTPAQTASLRPLLDAYSAAIS